MFSPTLHFTDACHIELLVLPETLIHPFLCHCFAFRARTHPKGNTKFIDSDKRLNKMPFPRRSEGKRYRASIMTCLMGPRPGSGLARCQNRLPGATGFAILWHQVDSVSHGSSKLWPKGEINEFWSRMVMGSGGKGSGVLVVAHTFGDATGVWENCWPNGPRGGVISFGAVHYVHWTIDRILRTA